MITYFLGFFKTMFFFLLILNEHDIINSLIIIYYNVYQHISRLSNDYSNYATGLFLKYIFTILRVHISKYCNLAFMIIFYLYNLEVFSYYHVISVFHSILHNINNHRKILSIKIFLLNIIYGNIANFY